MSTFPSEPYPLNNVRTVGVGKLKATMPLVLYTHSHTYAYNEIYSEVHSVLTGSGLREGLQLLVDIYFRWCNPSTLENSNNPGMLSHPTRESANMREGSI